MKLTLKTAVLQEMVSKAVKGASQNKLLPLTSLMSIRLVRKQLTLTTTDASNYLYVVQKDVEGDDFYVTVQVEQFSKLIAKMTSETVTLELDDSMLTVKGNGTYKIELPLDENGSVVVYPDPIAEIATDVKPVEINLSTVKTILNTNKAALADDMKVPVYTNYYLGDRAVTTDMYKVCKLDAKLFDEPMLLAPETMDLLDVMTDEKLSVYVLDDVVLFTSNNCVVYGHKVDGLEDFAIDAINELLDEKFKSTCKIRKDAMLSVLDRIGLFVGTYDDNEITLTFTKEGIDISSKQSDGVETLPYVESKNFKAYTCSIDIFLLEQQLKANAADVIELQYGNDRSVKLVDGAVTQIVALKETD